MLTGSIKPGIFDSDMCPWPLPPTTTHTVYWENLGKTWKNKSMLRIIHVFRTKLMSQVHSNVLE
jgi:hypothetical protein